MHLFKKQRPQNKQPAEQEIPPQNSSENQPIKKKRIRIGIRHAKPKEVKTEIHPLKSDIESLQEPLTSKAVPQEQSQTNDFPLDESESDLFTQEEILPTPVPVQEVKKPEEPVLKKKKTFTQKNMEGKPVYLEDTGEKLGTVFGLMYDANNNFIGYKIKDVKSDSILSFSLEHFEEDKDGLIFIPNWYVKTTKAIEKFEFKDRISPEITTLLVDQTISNEELYDIFLRHDDEMAAFMKEAVTVKEMLHQRLQVLERQRLSLKDNLMDLTEKRLIKDIDRRQFSEDVMQHRRQVNILDVNIQKCKELLDRLDHTSFGMVQKQVTEKPHQNTTDWNQQQTYERPSPQIQKPMYTKDAEPQYKQKYYELKERYTQLEDNFNELKNAVEKLMTKTEQNE